MRTTWLVWMIACNGAIDEVACLRECPDGTRRTSYDAVARGEGFAVAGVECETVCEPILTCLAPNIPTVYRDAGDVDHYECKLLDGLSSIPEDATVDFTFAEAWDPDAAQP